MSGTNIDVCIATYRRSHLRACLQSVARQELPDDVSFRIIVADNDVEPSARKMVTELEEQLPVEVIYLHAPKQNISVARNAALEVATADWIAFIDDDETAEPDWLARLLSHAEQQGCDAVFGPALASYPEDTPAWMKSLRPHDNIPKRRNGRVETGHTCNALVRREVCKSTRFDPALGTTGGEDTDFFFRLFHAGASFCICDDAVVHEPVLVERLAIDWLYQRQFRSGQSYAQFARPGSQWMIRALALLKTGWSMLRKLVSFSEPSRNFWALRAAFHKGAASGLWKAETPELYKAG